MNLFIHLDVEVVLLVSLLIRLYIKNYADINSPLVKQAYASLCSIVGIAFNILLFVIKFFAGMVSGSIAIVTDGFNNIADASSCLASFLGFRLASIGGGKKHPFGHGRYEWFMGFLSALLVLVMGAILARNSILAIIEPPKTEFTKITFFILICSIAVKFYMYLYNKKNALLIGSSAMKATATDCISDMCATTAILLSSLIQQCSGFVVDGWCSLLVSVFIILSAWKSITETVERLLGQAPDTEVFEKVRSIALAYKEISSVQNLIIHDYGMGRYVISLHIVGKPLISFDTLLSISNKITYDLSQYYTCETTIQIDFLEDNTAIIDKVFDTVQKIISKFSADCYIDTLYIVKSVDCSNVVLTIAGTDKLKYKKDEMLCTINQALYEINNEYHVILKLIIARPKKER